VHSILSFDVFNPAASFEQVFHGTIISDQFLWQEKLKRRFGGKQSRVARFSLAQTYQSGKNIRNEHKLYQVGQYTKWALNIPHGHKICQHFPFQDPPKYTQIVIFGMKKTTSGNPETEAGS
jgi:hypothetical protein